MWNYHPRPDEATQKGTWVRHGTDWFKFSHIVDDRTVFVFDFDGYPCTFPLSETVRAWDPEIDPYVLEEFRTILKEERAR